MPHALANSRLGGELTERFDRGRGGPGRWWIIDEPERHLSDGIVVPDLAGWRRERMPDYPDTAYVTPSHRTECARSSQPRRAGTICMKSDSIPTLQLPTLSVKIV